jgi:hypothetical protein
MASIRLLGRGYYGIESAGIVIGKNLIDTVNKAFVEAESLPAKNLKMHVADESPKTRSTPFRKSSPK